MIDHKLAKQLKDVGFVQMEGGEYICEKKYHFLPKQHKDCELVLLPTLSELIKECGDRFSELERYSDGHNIIWRATGVVAKESVCTKCFTILDESPVVKRKTPEEAVAKLYIAFNK